MGKISFECPNCHTRYIADEANIGKKAKCKKCEKIIEVPEISTLYDKRQQPKEKIINHADSNVLLNSIESSDSSKVKQEPMSKKSGLPNIYSKYQYLKILNIVLTLLVLLLSSLLFLKLSQPLPLPSTNQSIDKDKLHIFIKEIELCNTELLEKILFDYPQLSIGKLNSTVDLFIPKMIVLKDSIRFNFHSINCPFTDSLVLFIGKEIELSRKIEDTRNKKYIIQYGNISRICS